MCSVIYKHRTVALPRHKSIRKRKRCRSLSFPFSLPFSLSFPFPFPFSIASLLFIGHQVFSLFRVPLMEMRDMSYHHHYKQRDFHFAQLLVISRRKAGLTQEEVALQVGVAGKSIRNWEGGSYYPSEAHMQKLIELYLDKDVFEPGREREEAQALWKQL